MCGSLVEACGDVEKCHEDAQCWIEEAILAGNQKHPWLATAHDMYAADFPEKVRRSERARKATVAGKKIVSVKPPKAESK